MGGKVWAAATAFLVAAAVLLSPLPAQAAATNLDKGFAAAKKERWDEAVGFFRAAFGENPYNPVLLFNAGLAEANAGNEVLALAFLTAYLTAVPDAANRTQAEAFIETLNRRSAEKSRMLFDTAVAAVEILPPGPLDEGGSTTRRWDLLQWWIAKGQFNAGFEAEAKQTLLKARAIMERTTAAAEKVEASRFTYALEDLDRVYIREFPSRYWEKDKGIFLADAFEFDGAAGMAGKLETYDYSANDVTEVVNKIMSTKILALTWQKDFNGAFRILQNPAVLAEQLPALAGKFPASYKFDGYSPTGDAIWGYYLERGDLDGARNAAQAFFTYPYGYFLDVAFERLRRGEVSTARDLAYQIDVYDAYAWNKIAAAAILGQRTKALELARSIEQNPFQPPAQGHAIGGAVRVFAFLGDAEAANEFYKILVEREYVPEKKSSLLSYWHASPSYEPYLLIAKGKLEQARRVIAALKSEPGWPYGKDRLIDDLIWIAMLRGELELAETFARQHGRWVLLSKVSKKYQAMGKAENAKRLESEIAAHDKKQEPAGLAGVDEVQARKMEMWAAYIASLLMPEEGTPRLSFQDMDAFLAKRKKDDPLGFNYQMSEAASAWARETLRIRNLARF